VGIACGANELQAQGPVRPLANDAVIIAESPEPNVLSFYDPAIVRLSSGRLVAAYIATGDRSLVSYPLMCILVSDDGGATWRETYANSAERITHGRLFVAGDALYLMGQRPNLRIMRSLDDGETWSDQVDLTSGEQWHGTATNVWYARDHVYLVMERRVTSAITGWEVGELAPVLLRARVTDDLLQPASWTRASELAMQDILPGFRENTLELDGFGVPFFEQTYPDSNLLVRGRTFAPVGWLETNVVQIMDPDHVWFDPTGRTFHLFARANTGGTGYAAIAKVVENPDGTMTTMLEQAPSGRDLLFLPLPGGQMKFFILYDEVTKLYWMLGSQATDSMTRAEELPPERYGLPNNERHRMVLHFSKNLVDWCFAGLVAITNSPREARHYASMAIDGDDLVILSRSGDARAKSAHDGNLITFHRVRNFRALVY